MCLAIPGKIIAIKKDVATVDYGSQKTDATIIEGDFKEGDYVIVQGKIVVEKVPAEELKQWMALYEK
jgi:hydrogenase expression/formation protein HypC